MTIRSHIDSEAAAQQSKAKLLNLGLLAAGIIAIGCAVYLTFRGFTTSALYLSAIGMFLGIAWHISMEGAKKIAFLEAILISASLLLSFLFGTFQGDIQRSRPAIHRIALKNGEIVGRILRSGEAGVWVYEKTGMLSLVRWDDISRIHSQARDFGSEAGAVTSRVERPTP